MTYRITVDCAVRDSEIELARWYAQGAIAVEEIDRPGGLRLLIYFDRPREGAEPVDESIDWQAVSDEPWVPVEIGERFLLVPPDYAGDIPAGRIRLNYQRGQAWGTGSHATTQLCLEALELALQPGDAFLDVGVGAGLLSMATRALGASRVVGCDIDAASASIAAQHTREPMFAGSARSVRNAGFDVVAANVNSTVLENLRDEWPRILRPGGRLIGSGFRLGEEPALTLGETGRLERDRWLAIVYR
ncbi:MAG: 50S ribosomal protein L11 methyltransferase [Bryobacteraceae bacterium]|nr:50S ribosomal protein L11 methyltransferase [Bryobacteraceae bacterium]